MIIAQFNKGDDVADNLMLTFFAVKTNEYRRISDKEYQQDSHFILKFTNTMPTYVTKFKLELVYN